MKSTLKTSPGSVKDLITQMIDYLDTQTVNGKSVYQDWEDVVRSFPLKRKKTKTRFSYKPSRPIR